MSRNCLDGVSICRCVFLFLSDSMGLGPFASEGSPLHLVIEAGALSYLPSWKLNANTRSKNWPTNTQLAIRLAPTRPQDPARNDL